MASVATAIPPSVPFLKPVGIGRATSCRCRAKDSAVSSVSSVFKGMFMSVFPFSCVRIKKPRLGYQSGLFDSGGSLAPKTCRTFN
tara:strand:- start:52462 stop:52716 length:255 start_codon:yes stop_codon:yes gene_type:complete